MSDEKTAVDQKEAVSEEQEQSSGSPAGAQKPDTTADEPTVPLSRFNEVNNKFRELETQLADMQAKEAKRQEDALTEQEKWQELATKRGEELKEYQSIADDYKALNQSVLDAIAEQTKDWPEEIKGLIPASENAAEVQKAIPNLQLVYDKLSAQSAKGAQPDPAPKASTKVIEDRKAKFAADLARLQ